MILKEILGRLMRHLSSLSLVMVLIIIYLLGDAGHINGYLPENGKPLVLFMLVMIIVQFELTLYVRKQSKDEAKMIKIKLDDMMRNIEIDNLKQVVNVIYNRLKDSGEEWITSENLIKEINELKDKREKLGVNSYTESNLTYLVSRIRRG